MELLLMLDAARGAWAARATAVIPYYSYARSDKKDAPRISIAGRLVADLLATAGATRVLTMALHAPQVHGFFSVPVDHLNALSVLGKYFSNGSNGDLAYIVVVSPDLDNARSATQFARSLVLPVAAGSKQRIDDHKVVIDAIVGDVDGRDVIILDDEIATGGSIIELLNRLRERNIGQVTIACTHGLFTGNALERLGTQPGIQGIVRTNTVPLANDKHPPALELRTPSIAPLFAEAIRRIHVGESVSSLFSASV